MGALFTCPGLSSYGRGLREATVHNGACCQSFAALTTTERERRGLRLPAEPEPLFEPPTYEVDIIGVPALIAIVADLQRRATENPDELLEPTIVYVEIGPEHVYEEVLALIDLGRPYGLVVGHRRRHT